MIKNKPSVKYFAVLMALLAIASCRKAVQEDVPKAPDYSNSYYWIAQGKGADKSVDVFYVYPTIYNSQDTLIMDVSDPSLRKKAQVAMKKQAGVFTDESNLYAPYYRQMSMAVLSDPTLDQDSMLQTGLGDVKEAFSYFIKTRKKDNPFILAGHSQGSEVLLNLMQDSAVFISTKDQMVAAYLIGYSVTEADLRKSPHLQMAQDSIDNGVIISYNTQSACSLESPVLLDSAHCINPLSWSAIPGVVVSSDYNIGAVFFSDDGSPKDTIPFYTDAMVCDNAALVASDVDTADCPPIPAFEDGIYHVYDYSIFYMNLKQNVKARIEAYLNE